MTTTTENLAAALARVIDTAPGGKHYSGRQVQINAVRDGIAALAAYDAAPTPEPVRVLVHLEGGMVQDVLSNVPAEMIVIDYDTDDAADDELTPIPQGGKYAGTTEDARASYDTTTENAEFITNAIAAIKARAAELEAAEEAEQEATP